jgi:hypothetical protein
MKRPGFVKGMFYKVHVCTRGLIYKSSSKKSACLSGRPGFDQLVYRCQDLADFLFYIFPWEYWQQASDRRPESTVTNIISNPGDSHPAWGGGDKGMFLEQLTSFATSDSYVFSCNLFKGMILVLRIDLSSFLIFAIAAEFFEKFSHNNLTFAKLLL